jgi:cation/acetate symporter
VKKPLTDEDLLVRAAIDGRVAFTTGAFATAAALVGLLDRVGAPPRLVAILGPAVALVGLACVGLLVRTMRISRFYAGGRVVPPVYAGLAFASLAAGLFLPFLPPLSGGPSFVSLLMSFAGGLLVAALVGGPLLRKTGAFSIPDLIAGRFPNLALRLGIVAVIAAVGFLIAVAGFETAVEALGRATGASRVVGVWLVGIVLLFIVAPGGVAGVVWSSAGAAGLLIAGLGLPLCILLFRGASLPLPLVGDQAAWTAALARMVEWNGLSGQSQTVGFGVVVAIIIGIGTLAPLLAPATATSDRGGARRAGVAGMAWCVVFAALAASSMALATLTLDAGTIGARPELLSDAIIDMSRSGLFEICGGHAATATAAKIACAPSPGFTGMIGSAQVTTSGQSLLLGLSSLRGLGGAFAGLAGAGLIAVALVISAAGFQVFAAALGHDAFYRVRDATAMTSRRLAVTRLLMVVAVAGAGAILLRGAPDPRALIGLAIVFCAATITPLLALSIWPRAEGSDAAAALLAGLATAEAMIYIYGGVGSLDGVGKAAVIACAVSFVTGIAASFAHSADPTSQGGAFVHGVLRGESDLLNPDKGA